MRASISWLERQMTPCLVSLLVSLLVTLPGDAFAQIAAASPATPTRPGAVETQAAADPSPLPAAPQAAGAGQQSSSQSSSSQPGTSQQNSQPSTSQQNTSQPNTAAPPVGAAAAPYIRPGGVVASRPAGAAIAPAKQKRIRKIAIRVGLLVGAGIAIGAVVAASEGSPSRPH
jgi:hypothetical protein